MGLETGDSCQAMTDVQAPDAYVLSALLNHRDHRVTDEHYNHSANLNAGQEYGSSQNPIAGGRNRLLLSSLLAL